MTSSSRDEALVAQRHEAAEDRRHLDPREVLLVGLGVADQHGQVERETRDVGERVGRVDRERGEDGEDPLLEQPLAHPLLLAVELVPADQVDALLRELRDQVLAEETGMPLHQVAGAGPDPLEHLPRQQPGRGADRQVGRDPALEAGHAHHEELVEVVGEDRREAHPLEQRLGVVLGQLQDALVEVQPGELAVQEAVVEGRDGCDSCLVGLVGRLHVEGLVGGDVTVACWVDGSELDHGMQCDTDG